MQFCAVGEGVASEFCDRRGDGDGRQLCSIESITSDGLQLVRQHDRGQTAATTEGIGANGGHGSGYGDLRQILAVIECVRTDGGDANADLYFPNRGSDGVPGGRIVVSIVLHGTGAVNPQNAVCRQRVGCIFAAAAA